LAIDTLDGLNSRPGKAIPIISIVMLFEWALRLKVAGLFDLLYFGGRRRLGWVGVVFHPCGRILA